MLAKKFRLPIQDWFSERKKAITRKSSFFIVKIADSDLAYGRFGVVVSSKVSKSAVNRNKIKRTIFDFIRLGKLREISGKTGKDVLIIVLPKTAKLEKEEIEKELGGIIDY